MVAAPLKILVPVLASFVVPVFVAFTVPLYVQPLKNRVGLEQVTFPPKADVGPNVRFAVPVNVKLCGVPPICVNRYKYNPPAVNPPAPIVIVFVLASVELA